MPHIDFTNNDYYYNPLGSINLKGEGEPNNVNIGECTVTLNPNKLLFSASSCRTTLVENPNGDNDKKFFPNVYLLEVDGSDIPLDSLTFDCGSAYYGKFFMVNQGSSGVDQNLACRWYSRSSEDTDLSNNPAVAGARISVLQAFGQPNCQRGGGHTYTCEGISGVAAYELRIKSTGFASVTNKTSYLLTLRCTLTGCADSAGTRVIQFHGYSDATWGEDVIELTHHLTDNYTPLIELEALKFKLIPIV